MRVPARACTTPDGRRYEIRSARAADAGRVLDHAWEVHRNEPDAFLEDADEFSLTAERLRGLLDYLERADNGLFLAAFAQGEVVATLTVAPGRGRKVRHTGRVGLTVRSAWRRQGLGRGLLTMGIETLRAGGVLRLLVLDVIAGNEAARALYESCGFRLDGRRRGYVRRGDDYADLLLYSLSL